MSLNPNLLIRSPIMEPVVPSFSEDELGIGVEAGVDLGEEADFVVKSSASSSSHSMFSSSKSSSTDPDECLSGSLPAAVPLVPLEATSSLLSGAQSDDADGLPRLFSLSSDGEGLRLSDLTEELVGVCAGCGLGVLELDLAFSLLTGGDGKTLGVVVTAEGEEAEMAAEVFLRRSGLVEPASCFNRWE